jgi:hypothetical protein
LPPLRRFVPIGSCYRPLRPRLVSVVSRLRPCGTGLSPPRRTFSSFVGSAKLRGAAVQVPFPLVELRLPGVDRAVPGSSHCVSLISDVIAPVSNEIALVSGPRALIVA